MDRAMPVQILEVAVGAHRFQLRRFVPAGSTRARLLFVPALGVPAAKYDPLAEGLAATGVEVVLHEWRGGGSSSVRAARGSDWNYRDLLADLDATLAVLHAQVPRARWCFGGHSLGAQFAAMQAARQPASCAGLVLVAAGVPAPEAFHGRHRLGLAVLARIMPAVVAPFGYFPGHRLKFAGREAAGVMRDWAQSARRGGYADYGDGLPLDTLLAQVRVPVLGLVLADDWMAPEASLQRLFAKLGAGAHALVTLDSAELCVVADHFRWLRRPDAIVARIGRWLDAANG
jgi:predicted alpha/beta hydrolase